MNERLRLQYLDMLGVVQYVARMPLPGAGLSPEPDWSLPELPAAEPAANDHDAPSSTADSSPALTAASAEAHSGTEPLRTTPTRSAMAALTESPVTAAGASQSITEITATTPAAEDTRAEDQAAPHQQRFQCQVVLWPVDDLLILADLPRLDTAHTNLLQDIVLAIGRKGSLPSPKVFQWPLPQAGRSARTALPREQTSLFSAREHCQGMLDGGILGQPGIREILLFGDAPQALLRSDAEDQNGADNSNWMYRDWPVCCLPALADLLAEPGLKAKAWRSLQGLVRKP